MRDAAAALASLARSRRSTASPSRRAASASESGAGSESGMADSREGAAPGSTRPGDPTPGNAAPAVIVHGLGQAQAAVRAADLARGLVLLSAPGAGLFAGAGWFAALARAAAADRPGLGVSAVLDCADAPGAVLAGLRAGIADLVFTGEATIAERLAAIVAEGGARLLRAAPESLDLAEFQSDSAFWRRRLSAWLGPPAG